jgi:hypothetical protein
MERLADDQRGALSPRSVCIERVRNPVLVARAGDGLDAAPVPGREGATAFAHEIGFRGRGAGEARSRWPSTARG